MVLGSPEITSSRFRHCPKQRRRFRRLPIWAWILIACGSAIVILAILAIIIAVVRKSKRKSSSGKSSGKFSFPEPRVTQEKRKLNIFF